MFGVFTPFHAGLMLAAPVRPVLVEFFRAGDAGVQVEHPAGLGGGERDQVPPVFTGYK